MMVHSCLRLLGFGGVLIGVVLVGGAASVGGVGTSVVVASGSPFRHTCGPHAVRGYLVEPTATTVRPGGTLVAAWQADRAGQGADGIVAARSSDGGHRWTSRVVPGLSRCDGGRPAAVSDPWLSAGPDGIVYLITDAITAQQRSTIAVSRSLDDGRSWQRPVILERGKRPFFRFSDKPNLTADPYRPGVAFATWNDVFPGRRVMFTRTLDGGLSWSKPRVLAHSLLAVGRDSFPEIAVLPNGALTMVMSSYHITRFRRQTLEHLVQASTNLGASWSSQTVIDRLPTLPAPSLSKPRGSVRADPAVFSLTSGPDGVYLVSALLESRSRSRLVISREQPDGTWTHPRTIATVNKLAVLPTVADTAAGKLAVTWDSITALNLGSEALAAVNAAVSENDGLAWTTRPLGQPFVLPRFASGEFFIGDYQALTPTQSGFDAIDISSRRSGQIVHTLVESFTFG